MTNKTKMGVLPVVGILALAGWLMLINALGLVEYHGPLPASRSSYEVTYRISGTGALADVTFANNDGGTSQQELVSIPWTYTRWFPAGSHLYLSAQNRTQYRSNILVRAEIIVNDELVKTSESQGEAVIATASGMLP